ncbi:hypothetical protein [Massilicoli timonensis]|uniref:hypothetical protein n=1 Tax=Massilicoli timonensis TaxID=2015901 RepID=UPI0011AF639B|nr:hypothetical protein [Massilicoli timonensis]
MGYIDYAFFTDYLGNEIDKKTFDNVVAPSCDIVDSVTGYEVARNGLDSYPVWIQMLFKKACAMQCAYIGLYGLDISYTGAAGQGFTVGKVSVGDAQRAEGRRYANAVCPAVYGLLEQTGLLYRGIAVCSDPFHGGFFPTMPF